jgi:SAM-dependent methyltransferase
MIETSDAFGHALVEWVRGDTTPEIVERDDGVTEIGAGPEVYLMDHDEWPKGEKLAMRFVRGHVIDVGCGGGRVARYLQELDCDVVAMDSSALAIKAARLFGVKKTLCISIDELGERIHNFNTLILFGNNLGAFGTPARAKRTLTSWAKYAAPDTRILMESTNPLSGGAPVIDRAYCHKNLERGRATGQCRLRVWYDRSPSPWFSWFFASPSELTTLLRGTGWSVAGVLRGRVNEPYVAVLELD